MKRNTKLASLVLSLGCSLFLGANASAQNSPNPKVLYVGDSIAVETADTVGWWSHNYSNSTMTRAMFGGLAICDFTEGKSSPTATDSSLTQRVKEDKADIVVLSFVGNRFTSCMQNLPDNEAYYNKYKSDAFEAARQVTEAAKAAGIKRPKIMWVLQGPWDNGHTTRMNRQYREVAAATGDLVSDAGAEVSMAAYGTGNFAEQREIYTTVVPCSQFERDAGYCTDPVAGLARVHKDTDGVHYCLGTVTNGSCDTNSPGILRYGMRIAGDIQKALSTPSTVADTIAAAHRETPRILYVGDSIAFETANTVDSWNKTNFNAETKRLMWGGLAICDFTDKKADETSTQLERAILEQKPHMVIMQSVGNNLTPCMDSVAGDSDAYFNHYEEDAMNASRQVTEMAKQAGIPRPIIMWVMQGPERGEGKHHSRLNEIYKKVAKIHGDIISDAGFEVSKAVFPGANYANDRYSYTQFVPCSDYEIEIGFCSDMENKLAKVHKDNDPTHYCLADGLDGFDCKVNSPGILRYGMRISKDAKAALGF